MVQKLLRKGCQSSGRPNDAKLVGVLGRFCAVCEWCVDLRTHPSAWFALSPKWPPGRENSRTDRNNFMFLFFPILMLYITLQYSGRFATTTARASGSQREGGKRSSTVSIITLFLDPLTRCLVTVEKGLPSIFFVTMICFLCAFDSLFCRALGAQTVLVSMLSSSFRQGCPPSQQIAEQFKASLCCHTTPSRKFAQL